jgi:hypothetical protein
MVATRVVVGGGLVVVTGAGGAGAAPAGVVIVVVLRVVLLSLAVLFALHSSILEPDFDLAFCQIQVSC